MSIYAFTLFRGDTAAKPLTLRNEVTPHAALDLTGLTLTISGDNLQSPTDEVTQLFKKTMTVTGITTGQVEFALSASDWAGISTGDHFFDVQAVDGASKIETLVKGRFRILQDINKS